MHRNENSENQKKMNNLTMKILKLKKKTNTQKIKKTKNIDNNNKK